MYIFEPKRKFYYPEFIYDTAFWGYRLVQSESYMNHTQTKNSLGQHTSILNLAMEKNINLHCLHKYQTGKIDIICRHGSITLLYI